MKRNITKTNKALKVLMISRLPSLSSGGVETFAKLLLDKLVGVDFYILSQSDADVSPHLKGKFIGIHSTEFFRKNKIIQTLLYTMSCLFHIPVLLFYQRPDFVHIQYSNFFDLLLILIPSLFGVKTVITMHVSNRWRHYRIKILKKISILFLSQAKCIVCVSVIQRKMLLQLGLSPKRVIYIHCCIEDDFFNLSNSSVKKKKLRLLYLGRVVKEKGILDLIKAFALVKKQIREIELFIVGSIEAKFRNEISNLINRLQIEDIILFGPEHNVTNKIKLYDSTDVFVYPSYVDTFPLSIIEALSRGCPIIASNIAGIPDLVGSAGIVVPPGDIKRLSNEIISIYQSEEKRLQFSSNAVYKANQYKCQTVVEKYSNLYSILKNA